MKSSQSTAEVEGAYRLIRNPSVLPEAIAEAGFIATVEEATRHPVLLALEDTTTISFSHRTASDTLGHTAPGRHTRGLLVHSVLLYAPDKAQMVGLIEQQRWSRDIVTYGKKHQRKKGLMKKKKVINGRRPLNRWHRASGIPSHELSPSAIGRRISGSISITKSGRAALRYPGAHDRYLEEGSLFDPPTTFAQAGSHTLSVLQKGGRAARQVTMFISYSPVELKHPYGSEKRLPMTYIAVEKRPKAGLAGTC
ncbi:Transposase for transposon Tn5 [Budvicia aquatica]|uniref:Transposase for transposon Tn5 n=1 Tax=Budvicia aquatica TaxID=82979 RepID=A0A484ZI54_9GAMM|nr:Transposase for transposon Tn5 [Budvicia aquatica]